MVMLLQLMVRRFLATAAVTFGVALTIAWIARLGYGVFQLVAITIS
jgi:hypothetical protein